MAVNTKKSSMNTAPNGKIPAINTLQRFKIGVRYTKMYENLSISSYSSWKLTKAVNSCTTVALALVVESYSFELDADTDVCDIRNSSPSKRVAQKFRTTCTAMKSLCWMERHHSNVYPKWRNSRRNTCRIQCQGIMLLLRMRHVSIHVLSWFCKDVLRSNQRSSP